MEGSKRARGLDPLAVTGTGLACILFSARRYDEAIRELRAKLAVTPDDASTLLVPRILFVRGGKTRGCYPTT